MWNYKKIVFIEGCDGAGKTTLIAKLVSLLNTKNETWTKTSEPEENTQINSTPAQQLKSKNDFLATEATLSQQISYFATSRLNQWQALLSQTKVNNFICDRSILSSYAYQGYAYGENLAQVDIANQVFFKLIQEQLISQQILRPLIIFLDIEPNKINAQEMQRPQQNFFDQKSQPFHNKVYAGYKSSICEFRQKHLSEFTIINVERTTPEMLSEYVVTLINTYFEQQIKALDLHKKYPEEIAIARAAVNTTKTKTQMPPCILISGGIEDGCNFAEYCVQKILTTTILPNHKMYDRWILYKTIHTVNIINLYQTTITVEKIKEIIENIQKFIYTGLPAIYVFLGLELGQIQSPHVFERLLNIIENCQAKIWFIFTVTNNYVLSVALQSRATIFRLNESLDANFDILTKYLFQQTGQKKLKSPQANASFETKSDSQILLNELKTQMQTSPPNNVNFFLKIRAIIQKLNTTSEFRHRHVQIIFTKWFLDYFLIQLTSLTPLPKQLNNTNPVTTTIPLVFSTLINLEYSRDIIASVDLLLQESINLFIK